MKQILYGIPPICGKTYFADVINQSLHDIQPNRTKILEDSIKTFLAIPRQDTKLLILEQPQWIPSFHKEEHYYCPPSWMNNTPEHRRLLNCPCEIVTTDMIVDKIKKSTSEAIKEVEDDNMDNIYITYDDEEIRIIKEDEVFPRNTTKATIILKFRNIIIKAQYTRENGSKWELTEYDILDNPLRAVMFLQSYLLDHFCSTACKPCQLVPSDSKILLTSITVPRPTLESQYKKLVKYYDDNLTNFSAVISKIYDLYWGTSNTRADFVQVIAMIDSLFDCPSEGYHILKNHYNNCDTFKDGLEDPSTQGLINDE